MYEVTETTFPTELTEFIVTHSLLNMKLSCCHQKPQISRIFAVFKCKQTRNPLISKFNMASSENDRPGYMAIHSILFGGIGFHFYEKFGLFQKKRLFIFFSSNSDKKLCAKIFGKTSKSVNFAVTCTTTTPSPNQC